MRAGPRPPHGLCPRSPDPLDDADLAHGPSRAQSREFPGRASRRVQLTTFLSSRWPSYGSFDWFFALAAPGATHDRAGACEGSAVRHPAAPLRTRSCEKDYVDRSRRRRVGRDQAPIAKPPLGARRRPAPRKLREGVGANLGRSSLPDGATPSGVPPIDLADRPSPSLLRTRSRARWLDGNIAMRRGRYSWARWRRRSEMRSVEARSNLRR